MIRSVGISWLRGVQFGELNGLTRLNVLIGPNGSGKSTVLDALAIGESHSPGDAVGRVVQRRAHSIRGARWLVHRHAPKDEATIAIEAEAGGTTTHVQFSEDFAPEAPDEFWRLDSGNRPHDCIRVTRRVHDGGVGPGALVGFGADNAFNWRRVGPPGGDRWSKVLFVDTPRGMNRPLDRAYTGAREEGGGELAEAILSEVVPGLEGLEILSEAERPVLYARFPSGSVPIHVAGDGVIALTRIVLVLSALGSGLVLLEEPEVHQHPRAIWRAARAISMAAGRGLQIVLTTHSLELIDGLIAALPTDGLEHLTVFRTRLDGERLLASRIAGAEAASRRNELDEDLR